MEWLRCLHPRKTIDCWFCLIVFDAFLILALLILYYSPEFFDLLRGKAVVFEPKLNKGIVPVLFYLSAVVWITFDVASELRKKKKSTDSDTIDV
jgi:hypothetical protein